QGHLAAGAEALVLDLGHDSCSCVARRWMEYGEEAARDEVEDPPLVGRELVEVVLDVGRNDRVVVVDAVVADDACERELREGEDESRALRVLGDRLEGRSRRLQLRNEIAGEIARGRARIGDGLLALVERLRRLQRAPRREP